LGLIINIADNPKLPVASFYMAYIINLIDCTTFMFLSSISLWLVPTALQFRWELHWNQWLMVLQSR